MLNWYWNTRVGDLRSDPDMADKMKSIRVLLESVSKLSKIAAQEFPNDPLSIDTSKVSELIAQLEKLGFYLKG